MSYNKTALKVLFLFSMTQNTKHTDRTISKPIKKHRKRGALGSRPHKQKFGTSKLEEKFAKEFLDRLGIKYVYQFEAKSCKRYYDFCLPEHHILIEVDGTYFHGKGLAFESMSPMQKHNKMVDKLKDTWAALNGYLLLRFWEDDIHNNPNIVMDELKLHLGIQNDKKKVADNHTKRH